MKNLKMHLVVGVLVGAGCTSAPSERVQVAESALPGACDYPMAFGNATHTGKACPEVTGLRVAAVLPQDPDADAENAQGGFLQIHEAPPLTSGDYVVVPSKTGFESIFERNESYFAQAYRWSPSVSAPGATLVPAWTAKSDWTPIDHIDPFEWTNGYVQQFSPAIGNGSLYLPAAGGQLIRVSLADGSTQATIDPLAGTSFSGDVRTIVNSALTVDDAGNVYYTAVAWPAVTDRGLSPRASWLVKVRPNNTTVAIPWESITTANLGIPQQFDLCQYPFGTGGTKPAEGPNSTPPVFGCGAQRPATNAAPAVRPNGNIVVFTWANNAQGSAAFLVEVDGQTLTGVRAMDTRVFLNGCGVRIPITSKACKIITANGTVNFGFTPEYISPVPMRGPDIMDSAPTIATDGSLAIAGYLGGFTFGGGFDARGAIAAYNSNGTLRARNEEFGWEVTPSVIQHPTGTFSFLQDRQLYSDFDLTVAQYSKTFGLETTGEIVPDDDANAIDFLDAHIVFGPSGDHYAVNGSGVLAKFDAAGQLVDAVDLPGLDGTKRSMETLSGYFARDAAGRIYASYAGSVYVIDGSGVSAPLSAVRRALISRSTAAQRVGVAAKRSAAAATAGPTPPQ